jgi:chorismate mutase
MPIYEPDREQAVFDNVRRANPGPLSDHDVLNIYERIMDIMRRIQQEEMAPESMEAKAHGETELESDVND